MNLHLQVSTVGHSILLNRKTTDCFKFCVKHLSCQCERFQFYFFIFVKYSHVVIRTLPVHRHQIKFDFALQRCAIRPHHQGRSRGTVRNALISPRGRINWSWCEDHGSRGGDSEGERGKGRDEIKANCDRDRDRPSAPWYVLWQRLPSVHNLRHGRVLVNAFA